MNNEERREEHFSRSDRDMLVTLHAEMKGLRADVAEMKNGVQVKLADHEMRIRRVEWWGALAIGALTLAQFILPYVLNK